VVHVSTSGGPISTKIFSGFWVARIGELTTLIEDSGCKAVAMEEHCWASQQWHPGELTRHRKFKPWAEKSTWREPVAPRRRSAGPPVLTLSAGCSCRRPCFAPATCAPRKASGYLRSSFALRLPAQGLIASCSAFDRPVELSDLGAGLRPSVSRHVKRRRLFEAVVPSRPWSTARFAVAHAIFGRRWPG